MKLLVTGASGFMGTSFGAAAIVSGHEVTGIGRGAQKPPHWPGEYRQADFHAPEALIDLILDVAPDGVAHFAGPASVGESFQTPFADFEGATGLWFRLLDAIRVSGLRPLVGLASSAAVYGSPKVLPTPENALLHPESPYGFHKVLSEQVAAEFARCFGLSIVSLRFFSVFGARQRRLLVWEIFEQLRKGASTVRLKGTGHECRDFLPVEEAAAATLAILTAGRPEDAGFQAINIASGLGISVREVAETLRACAGSAASIIFGGEALRGNPARWQADIGKLQGLVPDWRPAPFPVTLGACAETWKAEIAKGTAASIN